MSASDWRTRQHGSACSALLRISLIDRGFVQTCHGTCFPLSVISCLCKSTWLCAQTEHKCVLDSCRYMQQRGFEVRPSLLLHSFRGDHARVLLEDIRRGAAVSYLDL